MSRFNNRYSDELAWALGRGLEENVYEGPCERPDLEPRLKATAWSRCDLCHKKLSLAENIPIFSYIRQGGRCKSCGGAIWSGHFVSEVLALLVMISLIIFLNDPALIFFWFLVLVVLAIIVYLDSKFMVIPDDLMLYLLLLGLIAWELDFGSLKEASVVWALLLGFLILEVPRQIFLQIKGKDGMGSADPRLSMACASFVDFHLVPLAVFFASVIGIVFFVIRARKLGRKSFQSRVPFGPFLILGYVAIFSMQNSL